MSTGTRDVESELIESVCERVRERVAPGGGRRGRGVRPRLLPPRAGGGSARARAGRPLRRRAVALDVRARPRAGRGARARVQPDVRAARLAVAAHGDRHRLRRHAVHRGLGEHGAQPARGRHPRARAPGRRRRVLHAHRGRPPARRAEELEDALQGVLAQVRAAVEDWQPMRERMEALVDRAGAGGRRRRRGRGGAGAAGVAVRPPLHVPRLPRVRVRRRAAARRRGLRPRAAARRRRATSRARSPSCRPQVRALALEPRAAGAEQGQRALDRSTGRATSTTSASRRFDDDGNVVGERRFLGLYTTAAYREVPADIPVLRRKVDAVVERAGLPARQPRPQGAGRGHRHLPARRAVPDLGRRALRRRARDPRARRAPARAAVHAHGPLPALRLLPRLPPARPLQHRQPHEDRRAAAGGASAPSRSTGGCG